MRGSPKEMATGSVRGRMMRHPFRWLGFAAVPLVGCRTSPPIAPVEAQVVCIALQHMSADELLPILAEVLLAAGGPHPEGATGSGEEGWCGTADPATNSLVFRGTADQLREIATRIAQLDVPAEPLR